nr:MAG TPA: hypothetical protein [Caudoviricetes sp.]
MLTLAVLFCVVVFKIIISITGWMLCVLFGFIHALLRH